MGCSGGDRSSTCSTTWTPWAHHDTMGAMQCHAPCTRHARAVYTPRACRTPCASCAPCTGRAPCTCHAMHHAHARACGMTWKVQASLIERASAAKAESRAKPCPNISSSTARPGGKTAVGIETASASQGGHRGASHGAASARHLRRRRASRGPGGSPGQLGGPPERLGGGWPRDRLWAGAVSSVPRRRARCPGSTGASLATNRWPPTARAAQRMPGPPCRWWAGWRRAGARAAARGSEASRRLSRHGRASCK